MPTQRILIDPVTRIEGHAKITIFVDDAGDVTDARFHELIGELLTDSELDSEL